MQSEVLRDALLLVRETEDKSSRAELWAGLAPHLATLSPESLHTAWQETLPLLAARTRQDLLSDLQALTPVLATLGGEATAVEAFHAIRDVGRWWP
jgi:hypothetical protein